MWIFLVPLGIFIILLIGAASGPPVNHYEEDDELEEAHAPQRAPQAAP
jgi:hypothetical protein